ncbi:S8 family serine peptidase [Emticicia sp. 21SJ11W-3]|uniref:S8 family serine peptidase n=1 Tax=Emticicia sp. 21SJ11W-3 TaxID=2916755 RepID=UPI00209CDFAD|nr:S8 family serine peptidase [Emticicia sp. 21SJ11W-3]UTA69962.1 S8 family serine peptidase [Emticicia sp. 21SJ11W-3]
MRKILLFVSVFIYQFSALAQNQYLVVFRDKANSTYSVNKPKEFLSERSIQRRAKQKIAVTERDLPPNTAYLAELSKAGAKVLYKSRWLNAALIETNTATLDKILKFSFVKGLEGAGDIRNARLNTDAGVKTKKDKFAAERTTDNGLSQTQLAMLGADKLHQRGFKGEGMLIGVLDAGFLNANNLTFFKDLYAENRVVGTYDFVANEKSVYEDDNHGTRVLSCMAAYEDGKIVGTAYKASYLLLRTEDTASETRREEANWLFGAEMADSVGVDVINSSLGYTTFDDPRQDYKRTDLNGDRALATRAADWAAQAGILVVTSAGNEGNDSWKYIGTPADADSVIAVGAVSASRVIASFSSYGPSADGRVKPELAAMGQSTLVGGANNTIVNSNGTSFASPLLAGFAASFWQAYPEFNNMQIRDFLIRSASQYESPDDRLGYGIPNFEKAAQLAELEQLIAVIKKEGRDVAVFPNPFNEKTGAVKVWILKDNAGKNFEFNLVDMTGKVIWSMVTDQRYVTLPSDYWQANYILKVKGENLNFSTRVIRN